MNYEETQPYVADILVRAAVRPRRSRTVVIRSALLLGAVLAAGLAACGPDVVAPFVVPVSPEVAQVAAGPQVAAPDTSVPDASATFAAQDLADRAKALQDAAALNKPNPPTTMTPAQESKSMPLPGQANDHSAPVSAKQRGN